MSQDIRCESGQLIGRIDDQGRTELYCPHCRNLVREMERQRVVVLHYVADGAVVETKIYADIRAGIISEVTPLELPDMARRRGWKMAKSNNATERITG